MSKDFRKIPTNRLHWYAGLDADCTLRLAQHQMAAIPPEFLRTWRDVHGPATWMLGCMERWGALLSEPNVREYDGFLERRIEAERALLGKYKLQDFNPKSNKQMADLVFGQLDLKYPKGVRPIKTDGGALSTSAEAVQTLIQARWKITFDQATGRPKVNPAELAAQRAGDDALDVIMSVLDLKDAREQRSKFGLGYLKHVGYDGRVHTTYGLARTLRLTSKNPQLQNLTSPWDSPDIPKQEDPGWWARRTYVPPEGWEVLSFDFGQIELRVAAELSGDDAMKAGFTSGVDFHTATAVKQFGKLADQIIKAERRIAKIINFRIPYGTTAVGLALELGCTTERAEEYLRDYDVAYVKFAAWRRAQIAMARTRGETYTLFNDWAVRRRIPEAGEIGEGRAVEKMIRHAEAVAQNTPVQAVANLICLLAMVNICRWLHDHPKVRAELNMNVHDAAVMYVHRDDVAQVIPEVHGLMTSTVKLSIPLTVDVERSAVSYGDLEKVKL